LVFIAITGVDPLLPVCGLLLPTMSLCVVAGLPPRLKNLVGLDLLQSRENPSVPSHPSIIQTKEGATCDFIVIDPMS
jgi:hypothetical protein